MRCQSLWWLECIYFPWITYRDETNSLFHPPLPSHSCADTPVFLAKPSIAFFTDYEIGPVYEVRIWFLYISHSASLFLKSLCCGNLKTCTHTHTHRPYTELGKRLSRSPMSPSPSFSYLPASRKSGFICCLHSFMYVDLCAHVYTGVFKGESLDSMSFFS